MKISPDKIISNIAHDLKYPLTSISGITELLLSHWPDFSDDEKREILKEIRETSDSTLLLLNDLLDWSRKTTEVSESEMNLFDARNHLHSVIDAMSATLVRKNITIENSLEAGMMVSGDSHMYASVVRNLLSNAVKSCHNGGRISVSAEQAGDFYKFCIRDNGIGMSKSQINTLFPGKGQPPHLIRDEYPAPSFGLILCHDFVEMNGGEIWAESIEGVGTCVYFTARMHPVQS
jgi:signal transduction histidine kinase